MIAECGFWIFEKEKMGGCSQSNLFFYKKMASISFSIYLPALFNAIRSSFIVWHLAKFNDIRYTQEHARHKDIATTQKYFDFIIKKRGIWNWLGIKGVSTGGEEKP